MRVLGWEAEARAEVREGKQEQGVRKKTEQLRAHATDVARRCGISLSLTRLSCF